MNDTPSYPTLREWLGLMLSPLAIFLMLSIATVLTIIGPFGSNLTMGLIPRFFYWLATIACTYSAGYWVSAWVEVSFTNRFSRNVLMGLNSLCISFAVAVVVVLLNGIAFGYWPSLEELPLYIGSIVAIALIIAAIIVVLSHQKSIAASAHSPSIPNIMKRLPIEKRGELYALSVEDHYVSVQTSGGTEMVLMRLGDAIEEVGNTTGIKVHRSHWVSIDAVRKVDRLGERAKLTLVNGTEIPVSRSNMHTIRQAGLLPKVQNG